MDLEAELQAELHHAGASRTDERIAVCYVGCGAPAAERCGYRRVTPSVIANHSAVRIGDDGVIKHVKHLEPELGAESLLEREVLEYGEIPILEARVAEDIPAHIAKVM